MLEETFGLEHPFCAKAMYLVADALRRQKKETEGIPYCERALETLDTTWDAKKKNADPLYARCCYMLGVLQEIYGRQSECVYVCSCACL